MSGLRLVRPRAMIPKEHLDWLDVVASIPELAAIDQLFEEVA